MIPAQFDYVAPTTLDEALGLLAERPDEAKVLAGGHSLIPAMKLRLAQPAVLVDIGRIRDLAYISDNAGQIRIGAMTTHYQIESSERLREICPLLPECAASIGDVQVRNRGTIGGSVANNDPAADYPAAVLGLGATVVTDKRRIAADDFFQGMFATALEPGELLTAIEFPIPQKAGYAKMRNPASRYVMAGAFVAKLKDGAVRVAVNGAGPCVFRQTAMEQALSANWSPDAVANIKQPADGLNSDIHGSAEYRAHLVTVMAKRAVAEAR